MVAVQGALLPSLSPAVPAGTLTQPALVGGKFSVTVAGNSQARFALQRSTNLVDWVPVLTNAVPFNFVETNAASFKQSFYRAVSVAAAAAGSGAAGRFAVNAVWVNRLPISPRFARQPPKPAGRNLYQLTDAAQA